MQIVIFGGTGFLGKRLTRAFEAKYRVYSSTRFNNGKIADSEFYFDFETPTSIPKHVLQSADIVINCIGYANVDMCEKFPKLSWKLNAEFPKYLAELLSSSNCRLIHISTDHFIQGLKNDSNNILPINEYGKSKLAGEQFIRKKSNHTIIRTNFFGYSNKNDNLFSWLIENLSSGVKVNGFTDVYFSPVSIIFLAKAIEVLIEEEIDDTINISSKDCISKYDFLIKLAQICGLDSKLIAPSKIIESEIKVKRPSNMCLDNSNFEQYSGLKVPTLDEMIEEEVLAFKKWKSS